MACRLAGRASSFWAYPCLFLKYLAFYGILYGVGIAALNITGCRRGEESGSPEFPMSFDFRLGLTHESHFLMPLGRIFRLGI